MIWAAPWVLLGLVSLPAVWLLLRLRPVRPRRMLFPPLALLADLPPVAITARRIPPWVLLLRLLAVALLVGGLAGPYLHPPGSLPGTGTVLLVVDDGWAAAADWPLRLAAAAHVLAQAQAQGRAVRLLRTASPRLTGVMTAAAAARQVAAWRPVPWPVDRVAAAAALRGIPAGTRIYLADGITDGAGFAGFMQALRPNQVIAAAAMPALLALAPAGQGLAAQRLSGPAGGRLLALNAAGFVLAQADFSADGVARIALPPPLQAQLVALQRAGPPSAGTTVLLDSASRTVLVGLVAAGNNAETPYLGAFYFLRRAMPATAQLATGPLAALAAARPGMIVLADLPLDAAGLTAARDYLAAGGVLLRFAGPLTAAAPDGLAPSPLLAGDRRLGGALSWTQPLPLAAFSPASPFAGLAVDPDATVSRQVLADPAGLDPANVWATLADGTPLVLGRRVGPGTLVTVLTTATTDWSSLAISGLFPAMLARLTALGSADATPAGGLLPLTQELTAAGALRPAATVARIDPAALSGLRVSAAAPPGLYGAGGGVLALNLGGHIAPPVAANLPGAVPLAGTAPPRRFGGFLLAAAVALLGLDLAVSLRLRGLAWLLLAALFMANPAQAQNAALQTELGYLRSGDPAVDQISAAGLAYIAADVTAHTSAALGDPVGLDPAHDDLGLYPLLYWMVLPAAPALAPAACTALTAYMAHGGLLVIDTPGGDADAAGAGAGFAPGAAAAVARVTACLGLPPLAALDDSDPLAHCFYILHAFPGRFTGAAVLAATPAARDADGASPVIIGQNDWAGAWARDAMGNPEQVPIPGGEDQRVLADRFGTNLVIYALTGTYKADQNAAPALLDQLGK